jgi:hypothetical protein
MGDIRFPTTALSRPFVIMATSAITDAHPTSADVARCVEFILDRRRAQGLSPKVRDPLTLAVVAHLVAGCSRSPSLPDPGRSP